MKRRVLIPSLLLSATVCCSLHAQQWTVFDMENSPLPSTNVKALAPDGEGGIWVGTDWGLCRRDAAGDWEVFQAGTSPLVDNNIRCLQVDQLGRLWIGTVSMGLQVKDGEEWTTYTPLNSPLPEFGVRDLFIDTSDAVWICTSSGLAKFDGTDWVFYNSTPESHDGAILGTSNTNAVAVSPAGTVCLGTFNGGLHFIQGSTVEVLTSFDDGFFDNTAVDVAFHPTTGARWVATPAAGLLRQQGPIVGGLWTQWSGATGFPSNAMTALAFDDAGDVWAGTQIEGLLQVRSDGTFIQYDDLNSGLPDVNVRSVLATDDGALWVGTFLGGLARLDPTVTVAEAELLREVGVFPNPTTGQFIITCRGGCSGAQWELLTGDGRLVMAGGSPMERIPIDAGGLNPGIYILRLHQEGFVGAVSVLVD